MEGCAAVDGGDGGGTTTWLVKIHVCGVKPVIGSYSARRDVCLSVDVVVVKHSQIWL